MYEIHFANGDVEMADSLRAARDRIRMRDIDTHRPEAVLPAEIAEDGVLVETWTSFEALKAEP